MVLAIGEAGQKCAKPPAQKLPVQLQLDAHGLTNGMSRPERINCNGTTEAHNLRIQVNLQKPEIGCGTIILG